MCFYFFGYFAKWGYKASLKYVKDVNYGLRGAHLDLMTITLDLVFSALDGLPLYK
jgi:hypothetical protein